MARTSVEQIVEHGEVKRGQIGVAIQDMNPALRKAFKLGNGQHGVLVTDVKKDSEADKAGLQAGDLIIAVNGKPTPTTGELRNSIAFSDIGETVKLRVLRDGDEMDVEVVVGEPQKLAGSGLHPLLKGVTLAPSPEGGVKIVEMARDSQAAMSGLRPGDILLSVNRVKVSTVEAVEEALSQEQDQVLLQVQRGAGVFFLVLR
ncbi:PDZ domain-containing protein [Marinobacterium aestuariivivens]|uniref:PDZ domain-containing protein n=1 Tax=Marinobacterium aestuariivivens TaxID=1698799 RepID=A0ABW2A2M1_9GAMM